MEGSESGGGAGPVVPGTITGSDGIGADYRPLQIAPGGRAGLGRGRGVGGSAFFLDVMLFLLGGYGRFELQCARKVVSSSRQFVLLSSQKAGEGQALFTTCREKTVAWGILDGSRTGCLNTGLRWFDLQLRSWVQWLVREGQGKGKGLKASARTQLPQDQRLLG